MPSKDAGCVAGLFVLGTLERGPAHGHEIRRLAERIDVENRSDAQIGSIYNALRRLESEGLIESLRVEQKGRRPTRTVYASTDEGRRELVSLRDGLPQLVDGAPGRTGVPRRGGPTPSTYILDTC